MPDPAADLVIRGGRVYTVEDALPWAEAVAVRGERILAVGPEDEILDLAGPRTEVLDAEGGLVLPGFVDAHNHVRLGTPDGIDLSGAIDLGQIHQILRDAVAADPSRTWVEAGRFMYGAVPGGRTPTADDLPEEITGGRPAFLVSYDAHTVWMNRPALQRFGIGRGVGHVSFGEVELDASGEPTGFVTGFAVMGLSRAGLALMSSELPGLSPDGQYRRLSRALDMAIGYGITTIVEPQNSPDDIPLFARARDEGTMRSRVIAAMFHPPGTPPEEVDEFEEAKRTHDDDRFRVGPIKLYIDDVIEPHTAGMLDDYANRPGERGGLFWDPTEFAETITSLERRGFQTFTHAIGDLGIRTALDAIEHARRVNGPKDARHQLVHCEVVQPPDQPRFAELGVVACMQPRHCGPDITGVWRENVGSDRWPYSLPWRALHDAGAVLAFSSDWDVAEMDPLVGIYTAVTRADLEGKNAWATELCVDLPIAIRGYTMGSAYANFADGDRGSVTVGKYADIVVLDRDLLALESPLEILETKVSHAVVAGDVVERA